MCTCLVKFWLSAGPEPQASAAVPAASPASIARRVSMVVLHQIFFVGCNGSAAAWLRTGGGKTDATDQVKMSATMPAYQPTFSCCVCLRSSLLSPVLETNVSVAAILPSFGA